MKTTLSILIPTLPDRVDFFQRIHDHIIAICPFEMLGELQIVSDPRDRSTSTGEKRNDLLKKAKGIYTWFIDDDDMIYDYALVDIFEAIKMDPDVICFNGLMTTDGMNPVEWEIRLGHPYEATTRDGKEYYLRFPNHISPMKREKALMATFPNKTIFEDYAWAEQLHKKKILKTEFIINKPIYHYLCRTK